MSSFSSCVPAVAVALAALVASGCAARRRAHRPGEEWLAAIRFEGNHALDDDTLVTGLALHRQLPAGRAPDPYVVQLDADRVRGDYLRRGYLAVAVRPRTDRRGDATTVTFAIDEGVRATTRVVITGLPDAPAHLAQDVRAAIHLADGAPFDYATFDLAKDQLRRVVEDAGYANVTLEARVVSDRANHAAVIELDYDVGPACTFGEVQITGATGELRAAIERRVQFHAGQAYSAQAIIATQQALYGLGRFSTVRVQPVRTGEPVVGVQIDVSESARHEVRLGGGFGLDPLSYEVRARAGYTVAGRPSSLDTVTLELRPAYAFRRDGSYDEPRIRALARLERQDLLWTYSRGDVEVGYSYVAVEAYTSYGPRARLGFSTPLGSDRLQLRVGWSLQRLDFRNVHPLIDPALQQHLGLDRSERNGSYEQNVVVDLRDSPVDTHAGVYAELHATEGTRFAGGAFEYVELVPELRGFVPVGRAVLAARVRGGKFYGDVPVTERLFGGGSTSQRGFSERRLSPSVVGDVDGTSRTVPYGGAVLVEAGIEARLPIGTIRKMPVGGVVFLDGADVTETAAELDLGHLHWALGLGLRLQTILGPVRFDVGYRLDRTGGTEPDPDSTYAFHLSLGEAF